MSPQEQRLTHTLERLRVIDIVLNDPYTHYETVREMQREKSQLLHGTDATPEVELNV